MAKLSKIHPNATPIRIHFINEWMEKRRLKPRDVTEALGVDKATISRWQSGMMPTEKYLVGLAELFSLDDPHSLFRHPDEDWIARFLRDRPSEEIERMIRTLESAFPKQDRKAG